MKDFILIAEIKSTFDSGGYVTIESFSDFPSRFFRLVKVYVTIFGGTRELFVEDVKCVLDRFVMKFKNFNSSENVAPLIGTKLFVSEKDLLFNKL